MALYFNSDPIRKMEHLFSRPLLLEEGADGRVKTKGAEFDEGDSVDQEGKMTLKSKLTALSTDAASLERQSLVFKVLKCLQDYCDEENVSKQSIETILLSGGGLNLSGLAPILLTELETKCVDDYSKINAIQQKDPICQIINGAKVYACMKRIDEAMISKERYNEEGPQIINKVCF